jgi:hypothetical protein
MCHVSQCFSSFLLVFGSDIHGGWYLGYLQCAKKNTALGKAKVLLENGSYGNHVN